MCVRRPEKQEGRLNVCAAFYTSQMRDYITCSIPGALIVSIFQIVVEWIVFFLQAARHEIRHRSHTQQL